MTGNKDKLLPMFENESVLLSALISVTTTPLTVDGVCVCLCVCVETVTQC